MIINLKGKTILIVDDDPASLFLFSELLEPTNAIVLRARDGNSALKILEDHLPDLVLLDIKLSDTTGFLLLKEIRKSKNKTYVIAQTAYALEVFHDCIEAGFDEFIGKPINSAELFGKIDRLLNSNSKSIF